MDKLCSIKGNGKHDVWLSGILQLTINSPEGKIVLNEAGRHACGPGIPLCVTLCGEGDGEWLSSPEAFIDMLSGVLKRIAGNEIMEKVFQDFLSKAVKLQEASPGSESRIWECKEGG